MIAPLGIVLLLAAPPAPTVDAIVADYVAARGGVSKLRSIQTLRQTGRAFADGGRQAIVRREIKRPDKSRFEFTFQGVTAVYVANGASGWQVSPFEGQLEAQPLPEDAIAEAMELADIEGPLVNWKAKGHRVELAGKEKVGGRDAYKLHIEMKSGAERVDYIDVKSHRHVRSETTRQIRGRTVRLETTFSGHEKRSGVLFPTAIEVAAAGRPQRLRLVVEAIDVNPPLDDARFERAK